MRRIDDYVAIHVAEAIGHLAQAENHLLSMGLADVASAVREVRRRVESALYEMRSEASSGSEDTSARSG